MKHGGCRAELGSFARGSSKREDGGDSGERTLSVSGNRLRTPREVRGSAQADDLQQDLLSGCVSTD